VDFLIITHGLNGILMIVMPVGLTIYLTRKFKMGWRLFWIGAATFIFSQILHIPFNALVTPVFNQFGFIAMQVACRNIILAVFFGLSAGLFEELSRYAMFKWWAKEARSWSKGLLAGAGHGGVEAIILGLLVIYGYIQMLVVRGMDMAQLVTPDQVELAQNQIQTYWSMPWYVTLLGALERLFTIPLHLACSVIVLQAFTRRQSRWLGLAILYHALVDGVAVFVTQVGFSAVGIEAVIGIFCVISIMIIYYLRQYDSRTEITPILLPENDKE
jgi:uncharacterized membrane protein YhfC